MGRGYFRSFTAAEKTEFRDRWQGGESLKAIGRAVYSQVHLNKVARQRNERPRKTLGFETPAERFSACVASTS